MTRLDTDQLRAEKYNAVISYIRVHNPDLWIVKVRPDDPPEPYKPGQYTTLGLGYWEPKSDGAVDPLDEERRARLALRSYSVSSPIVDDDGELIPRDDSEFEFYIVRVRPGQELPALTPRLFAKQVGDRVYMGRKFAGRYTLQGVGSDDNVLFLSTGTGEAPQNAMTAELLRQGHRGRILNVVCVRFRDDLAYTEQQAIVERRWPNYRYHAFATREPDDGTKVYIQDLLRDGTIEGLLGAPLDPQTAHVFVCGNPAMIGLPRWDDDGTLHFPETVGVSQLLHERGFTLDHRRERGNVHYEEYWKERTSADA